MRIAVDALGGDHAPAAPAAGALAAVERFPDVEIVLVGDPATLDDPASLDDPGVTAHPRVHIHPAPRKVDAAQDPVRFVRAHADCSARVCAELLRAGDVQGVVTMGNTGAAVGAATLYCRRLAGVRRTGIAVPFPRAGGVTTLIDGGANPDARAADLHQYAIMAVHYARSAFRIDNPRVGILSIGEEEHKGNRLVAQTWALFRSHPVGTFIGNVEARELMESRADVVVSDGFVGNVALKAVEGMAEFILTALGRLLPEQGIADPRPMLAQLVQQIDYSKYGGAPLLGIDGGYLIGHGRSGPEAYENGVGAIRNFVANGVGDAIVEELAATGAQA